MRGRRLRAFGISLRVRAVSRLAHPKVPPCGKTDDPFRFDQVIKASGISHLSKAPSSYLSSEKFSSLAFLFFRRYGACTVSY